MFPIVHDVVIYGGTAGGVVSAITAAQEGATGIVLEPTQHIGGMVTGGLGTTDKGVEQSIGGMSRRFYERVYAHYQQPEAWKHETREAFVERPRGMVNDQDRVWWPVEPSVASRVLKQLAAEAKVTMLTGQRLKSVRKSGAGSRRSRRSAATSSTDGCSSMPRTKATSSRWRACHIASGARAVTNTARNSPASCPKRGRRGSSGMSISRPAAPITSCCSACRIFRAGRTAPPITRCRRIITASASPMRRRIACPSRGRTTTTHPLRSARAVHRAEGRRGQSHGPAARQPVEHRPLPNRKTDINDGGPFSTDYIGANWDYPEGDLATRQRILQDHMDYTKGLLYFLGHDERVPSRIQQQMQRWGYPKDEYTDTGNWTPQLYIREARRMVGDYVMIQQDIQQRREKPDSVGMGSYNADSHLVQRIVNPDGFVRNEGNPNDRAIGHKPYEIPYRCLTPQRGDGDNLFATFCVSASHMGFASVRMEPVFMILSESAGVAAATAVKKNIAVQDVPVAPLQQRLNARGQRLWLKDVPAKKKSWLRRLVRRCRDVHWLNEQSTAVAEPMADKTALSVFVIGRCGGGPSISRSSNLSPYHESRQLFAILTGCLFARFRAGLRQIFARWLERKASH